jgi:ribose transport system substrate-binding protein
MRALGRLRSAAVRVGLLSIVAVALQVAPVGCDRGNSGGGGGSANTAKGGGPKIAVIPKGTTHVFWKSVEQGALKGGRELGADVVWKGPLTEADAAQQIKLVEQFTQEGVAGICLAPLDANQLRRPVQQAMAKKIPVVIFDSGLNGEVGKDFVSYVATDNHKGGVLAGEELVRLLGGKGKVVLLKYNVGSASTEERERGFLEVLAKHPGIQVIEKDQYGGATAGESQRKAENMIDKLREADGIFCSNESLTVGMLNVLRSNGLAGQKKFVGFDASPFLISALKAGDIQALVSQNPTRMGFEAVNAMVTYLQKGSTTPHVDTGCALVTKENLESPEIRAILGEPAGPAATASGAATAPAADAK